MPEKELVVGVIRSPITEARASPAISEILALEEGVLNCVIRANTNFWSQQRDKPRLRSIARETRTKPPIMLPAINNAFLIPFGWTSADVAEFRRSLDIEAWVQLPSLTHISPR